MLLHITTSEGVPIYMQIVTQIKHLVASGRLSEGDELLPIRALAEQLVVNPNTVARAYRELEMAGVVEKRRTAGTYVSGAGSPLARGEQARILTERIDALVIEAQHMSFSTDELIEMIRARADHLQPKATDSSKEPRP
ncbi:MAG: GntR family transcriptional regulator [Fimbriimonas sp.]|nr:GntR family transcriptional regulator [Fimbriimonas sp.]